MAVSVGDRLPEATLYVAGESGPETRSTADPTRSLGLPLGLTLSAALASYSARNTMAAF